MPTSHKNNFDHDILSKLTYPTPFFVFSKEKINKKYQEFQKYFPGAAIHYAMKANSEPEILKIMADNGCGFELASVYELNMLKEIGVDAKMIIYGSAIKPIKHIKDFFDYGVEIFAFDSLPELEKIAAVAPGSKVYVRTVVNDAGSVFKFSEKFGTGKENIVPLLERARVLGLIPYGISFHVGSQASNPLAWSDALKGLHDSMDELSKVGIRIEVINIGGGYPCMYASSEVDLGLEEIADNIYGEYKKLPYQPKIIIEPGRALIASAAVLLASVIGKVQRRESTWLFLDAGVYDALYEAMAFQGSTRYRITSLRSSFDSGEMLFAIAGPTGDSCDIITREALLPTDIEVGDKLTIHDVGAYSLVCSSKFNGFPKPPMYLI
jgi:ornithine decarboxylase